MVFLRIENTPLDAMYLQVFYGKKFQIVSFVVVNKSEATSRECLSKSSICSWFVKMQGFYSCVYR